MNRSRLVVAAVLIALLVVFVLRSRRHAEPDTSAVLAQVRQLNRLSTVKYTIQKIVTLEEQKQPVGSEKILLVMQATVEAGVDLASLRPEHVQRRADGALVVHLPAPQILHVYPDEKETRVWDRQKTWWTPWVPYSLDLEKKARLQGLEAARNAALEMGILRQAEQNAEASIRGLLQLAGVANVVIIPGSAS